MDFYVVLDRQGYRVARRRRQKARVGVQHRVTKEDAIKWCVQHHNTCFTSLRADVLFCCVESVSLNDAHATLHAQVPDEVRGRRPEQVIL